MTNSRLGRTFAAIVCSVLVSAACVAGAVGPATAVPAPVATVAVA